MTCGERIRLVNITTVPQTLKFLSGQAAYFRSRGFESIAVSSPGEMLEEFALTEQVSVRAVEMPRRISPLLDLGSILRICRFLRQVRPHIVHAHTPKGGLLGTISARLARVPVSIYQMHGTPMMTATGSKRTLLRWAERTSCVLAHQVFCVSNSLKELAVHEGLVRPDRIGVVLNGSCGVDAEKKFNPSILGSGVREQTRGRFGIPHDAVVVGFIGRIVRDKGIAELAKAWSLIREEFPNAYLLVVGHWEPQDPIPHESETVLRNDARIALAGADWNTPPLYAAMDVVCLPTYREGFPIVPLEAAAMGLPVVATSAVGCVDAVVDGVTGTLVPVGDPNALAEAVRSYLRGPELRVRHGRSGRERVLRDFRREDIHEALYKEYVLLLRQKGILWRGW